MKTLYTYFLLTALLFSSCNDWLDVDLVNKVEESKLFSTEQGFQEALAGVYSKMSKAELYGRRLTFGTIEVLGQSYDYSNIYNYYKSIADYDYLSDQGRKEVDPVWADGYYTIALINNILYWNGKQGEVMKPRIRKQLIGEATALRAYMHFDLWRLYAPAYKQDSQAKNLPYNRTFGVDLPQICTSEQFINYCIQDLEEALVLLEDDPIKSVTPYTLWDDDDENTRNKDEADLYVARMNYYAIKGLLARIYITRDAQGDKKKARELAQEVIDSERFSLVDYDKSFGSNDAEADVLFSDEHIFTLRNTSIKAYSEAVHYVDNSGLNHPGNLQMSTNLVTELFAGNNDDFRSVRWINNLKVSKYYINNTTRFHRKVPLIKLSEIYLIAAEGWLEDDPDHAKKLVEDLRRSRFIEERGYELVQFNREVLLAEMRREFLFEGQLFYIYKRWHHDIIRTFGTLGNVPASNDIFVWPVPEHEIENNSQLSKN